LVAKGIFYFWSWFFAPLLFATYKKINNCFHEFYGCGWDKKNAYFIYSCQYIQLKKWSHDMFVPSCVNKVLHEIIGVRSQKDAFVGERTRASQTSHCVQGGSIWAPAAAARCQFISYNSLCHPAEEQFAYCWHYVTEFIQYLSLVHSSTHRALELRLSQSGCCLYAQRTIYTKWPSLGTVILRKYVRFFALQFRPIYDHFWAECWQIRAILYLLAGRAAYSVPPKKKGNLQYTTT
jgi:hypothetical protein